MNIVLLFSSWIMFIYWMPIVCRCMKPHHYLGLGAITVSTWRNSHLSKVLMQVCVRTGVHTHFLEPCTVLGVMVSSLEMFFQVLALMEEEYFSCITESEEESWLELMSGVLVLTQGDPLSLSQPWTLKGIQNVSPMCLVRMEDYLIEEPNDIRLGPYEGMVLELFSFFRWDPVSRFYPGYSVSS